MASRRGRGGAAPVRVREQLAELTGLASPAPVAGSPDVAGLLAGPVLAVAPRLLGRRAAPRRGGGPAHRGRGVRGPDDPGSHAYRGEDPAQRSDVRPAGPPLRLLHLRDAPLLQRRRRPRGPGGRRPAARRRGGRRARDVARVERGSRSTDRDLARGPARLCQALGIGRDQNGVDLEAGPVTLTVAGRAGSQEPGSARVLGWGCAERRIARRRLLGHRGGERVAVPASPRAASAS